MKAGIRRGMNTLDNIHKATKKEFLDKGFQMASLRNIGRCDDRCILWVLQEQGGVV